VPFGTKSLQEAADLMRVGRRSVARAHKVQDHGIPELIEAVEAGGLQRRLDLGFRLKQKYIKAFTSITTSGILRIKLLIRPGEEELCQQTKAE